MTGSPPARHFGVVVQGQMGDDPRHHIADVGHAFLQIFVVDLSRRQRVFIEQLVQGGAGIDLAMEDGGLDLADECRIAQQQAMSTEDGGLVLAELLVTRAMMASSSCAAAWQALSKRVISSETSGGVQILRLAPRQHRIDAIRASHGDARRNGDAFEHACNLPGHAASGNIAEWFCR